MSTSRLRSRSSLNTRSRRAAIAVVGGAIMDLVFETERMPENDQSLDASSLAYKPGGKGSNTAIAIYRAQHNNPDNAIPAKSNSVPSTQRQDFDEVDVYLNTAVGKDPYGGQLKDNLKRNGINISGIRVSSNDLTGVCAVFVDEFSGNSRDIGFPGANTNWTPENRDSLDCLAGGTVPDLLVTHLENKRETIEQILATAGKTGVETLLNPSPVKYLVSSTYKHVTHLLINESEAAELSAITVQDDDSYLKAARYFIELGVKYVVITLGEKGAFYATAETHGRVDALKGIQVKDTTGAGDTFAGNYALEYVRQGQQWDIKKAVERCCKAAARTIGQLGAQDAIPWADEIDDEDSNEVDGTA